MGSSKRHMAAVALGIACVLCLCACAQATAKTAGASGAKAAVSAYLEAPANGVQGMEQVLGDAQFDPGDYGVSSQVFWSLWSDGLTYTVGDAQVDGNTATVPVTLHVKKIAPLLTVMTHARDNAVAEDPKATGAGYADEQFNELTQGTTWGYDDVICQVTLTYEDGTWTIDNKRVLAVLLLDGYDTSQLSN